MFFEQARRGSPEHNEPEPVAEPRLQRDDGLVWRERDLVLELVVEVLARSNQARHVAGDVLQLSNSLCPPSRITSAFVYQVIIRPPSLGKNEPTSRQ